MSLTSEDLQHIRTISTEVNKPLHGELIALRNDVKEIYDSISELQSSAITDKKFAKLSVKNKLLTINAELLLVAKQTNTVLPR